MVTDRWGEEESGNTGSDELGRWNPESGR